MSRFCNHPRRLLRTFCSTAGLLLMGGAAAQDLQMQRAVIAPAGGKAAGGGFVLDGTLGQPVSGVSTGDGYVLESGFHQREALGDALFANGFEL